jgi:hypothetical protein
VRNWADDADNNLSCHEVSPLRGSIQLDVLFPMVTHWANDVTPLRGYADARSAGVVAAERRNIDSPARKRGVEQAKNNLSRGAATCTVTP